MERAQQEWFTLFLLTLKPQLGSLERWHGGWCGAMIWWWGYRINWMFTHSCIWWLMLTIAGILHVISPHGLGHFQTRLLGYKSEHSHITRHKSMTWLGPNHRNQIPSFHCFGVEPLRFYIKWNKPSTGGRSNSIILLRRASERSILWWLLYLASWYSFILPRKFNALGH